MSSEVAWDCPQCGMHNVAADAAAGDLCCKACGEPAPPLGKPRKPRKPRAPKASASEDAAPRAKRSPRKRGVTPLAQPHADKPSPKPKPRPKPKPKPKPQAPDAGEPQPSGGGALPPPGFSWQCPECGAVHVVEDPDSFDMCPACGYEVTSEELWAHRVIPKPHPKPLPKPQPEPKPIPPPNPPSPPTSDTGSKGGEDSEQDAFSLLLEQLGDAIETGVGNCWKAFKKWFDSRNGRRVTATIGGFLEDIFIIWIIVAIIYWLFG